METNGDVFMNTTLILGNSRDARGIAEALSENGTDVLWALPDHRADTALSDRLNTDTAGRVDVFPISQPFSCRGSMGRFEVTLTGRGETVVRTVSSIILADDVAPEPNFSLYGLDASAGVMSLSQMHASLRSGEVAANGPLSGDRIAFITGLAIDSQPVTAEAVMHCALRLQEEFNRQTYIFTGNLKVAGNGLEALYRQTKKAGTVYVKFTASLPDIRQKPDGRVSITYVDEILRETFRLEPDIAVIDERPEPSAFTRQMSKQLAIDTGTDGFAQAENVHRATVFTNRKGIFVAGRSRGIQTDSVRQADIGNAVLSVLKHHRESPDGTTGKAEIDPGQCVRCLTCFRLCPYGAISLSTRVTVDPRACEGCGICAAECPRFAIKIHMPAGEAIADRIPEMESAHTGAFVPSITAFCCSRSAMGAGDLATCMGYRLPEGLRIVQVPCAGSISLEHIFSAFRNGADGVMVLTCHPGNCHSEHGNVYAHQRVAQVDDRLIPIGFAPGRLVYHTLAANMGTEFAETVSAFEKAVLELGPSRLGVGVKE